MSGKKLTQEQKNKRAKNQRIIRENKSEEEKAELKNADNIRKSKKREKVEL